MKKAFLSGLAIVMSLFVASSAFAEEFAFEGKVESLAEVQKLKAAANNYVVDLVVTNYTSDLTVIITDPAVKPPLAPVVPQTQGRVWSERYPYETIRLRFQYGTAKDGYKTFDKTVWRRTTVELKQGQEPLVTEFK